MYHISNRLIAGCIAIVASVLAGVAQSSHIVVDKNLVYRQGCGPERADNYLYTHYYTSGKDVYNLKGFRISHAPAPVADFKVSPAGYSYAVLSGKGDKYSVRVYDVNVADRVLARLDNLPYASAIEFSPDSRSLYVAEGGAVRQLSARTLGYERSFAIDGAPRAMVCDASGMYLVCVYDRRVDVYNLQQGVLRKSLPVAANVADAAFTAGGDALGIVSADGVLSLYNTRDFGLERSFEGLGRPLSLSFHPEGKYAAVGTDGNRVVFVNLVDTSDRPAITDAAGPRAFARFVTDGKGDLYIAYDAGKAVAYKRISGFIPNYTALMRDQLNERMREWTKMRPMETEAEYAERVNEESIARQRRLFANEIATSLAGDLISHGTVTLGRYNPGTGTLSMSIGSLPTVYLEVPQEDIATFGDGSNLQFSNAVYGLTPDDTFELIYVDVFNPSNGKKYSFDNLDRRNLDFLATDDSFVSLDLIRQSTREDVLLKGIKDRIVDDARARSLLSEHTSINVDTRIVPSYDASGRPVKNYRVAFDYSVEPAYSEREDFPAGKYMMAQSAAASSMMDIIVQAFNNDFAPYIAAGKKLVVEVGGSADAIPVNRAIAYDGIFGEFENEPVRVDGDLTGVTVTSATGIRTNEQLAFMRARSMRAALDERLPQLGGMDTDYRYSVKVAGDRGGQYRRINVVFTFIDAL